MIHLKKIITTFLFINLLYSALSFAKPPSWEIIPNQSSLTFTATQNSAPITGEFTKFSGEIYFDLDQLKLSHVHIIVDIASLKTSYNDLTQTLFSSDWFNIKTFPNAEFKSTNFTKIKDNQFKSEGILTIRNKSLPISLIFFIKENKNNQAKIQGKAIVDRKKFNVGIGEWSDTNEIKNQVEVNFIVTANKNNSGST